MGSFSIWHWLIVLLVVILVFGTKKLRNLGSDLGAAVKGFKEGMRTDDEIAQKQLANNSKTIEGEAKESSQYKAEPKENSQHKV